MKVITITNQKGGVGKTTTTINLAGALTTLGKKILVIDIDPQGHLTSGLDMKGKFDKTSYDILMGDATIREAIVHTEWEGLDLIPAGISLANAELQLSSMPVGRETMLKEAIEDAKLSDEYDFIFIDTNPSLGNLTINAFCAAESLIIPMEPEIFALEGVNHLLKVITLVRKINKNLDIEGVLLTKVHPRSNNSKEIVQEVNEVFKDKVFKTYISLNEKVKDAQTFRTPITYYDPKAKAAEQYMELAKELIVRCQ